MQNFMSTESWLTWFNGLRLEFKSFLASKKTTAFNSLSSDLLEVEKDNVFKVEFKFIDKIWNGSFICSKSGKTNKHLKFQWRDL